MDLSLFNAGGMCYVGDRVFYYWKKIPKNPMDFFKLSVDSFEGNAPYLGREVASQMAESG